MHLRRILAAGALALGIAAAVTLPSQHPAGAATAENVFAFGDAPFLGSTASVVGAQPLVGLAPTPSGHGYWLAATDGGVFAFGDASYYGSLGGRHLNQPIVAIAATPSGHGYWLAGADGGIFAFGDAAYLGGAARLALAAPVTAMVATPSGHGYWLLATDGGVFAYGDAAYLGAASGLPTGRVATAIAPTPTGAGYWIAARTAPAASPGGSTSPGGTGSAPAHSVSVYFATPGSTNCSAVSPVTRSVSPPQLLAGALGALLAGPTATESAAGYTSFFSASTAGMLNWAHVLPNGVARIDFADFSSIIPNASSSCGSQQLLASLDATATQFASVTSAVYSFNGSVAAFYEWLQLAPPTGYASAVPTTPALADAVTQADSQEHNLQATYANVVSTLGSVAPFASVGTAEAQHISVLQALAAAHQVTLPTGPFPGQSSPATLAAACQLGASLEQQTVAMYDSLLAQVSPWSDATQVFLNLRDASSQHLAAFQRCS